MMTAACRQTGSCAGNMGSRGTRHTSAEGEALSGFAREGIEMSASLRPDRMVCVPCHRCGRDQFIITDAAGLPVAYDGSGFAATGLSL